MYDKDKPMKEVRGEIEHERLCFEGVITADSTSRLVTKPLGWDDVSS